MGFREITLQLTTDSIDQVLNDAIAKQLGIRDFTWQIQGKSLDARKKSNIHYAFGEGGAGTFSDGKLTSRTKKVVREKLSSMYRRYPEFGLS